MNHPIQPQKAPGGFILPHSVRIAAGGKHRMKLSDFDYELSRERIAQRPSAERDASRLLLLDRGRGSWEDRQFRDLPELLQGDELIVVNNARVLPARLFGRRIRATRSRDRPG